MNFAAAVVQFLLLVSADAAWAQSGLKPRSFALTPTIEVIYQHGTPDENADPAADPRLLPVIQALKAEEVEYSAAAAEIRLESHCQLELVVTLAKAPYDPAPGFLGFESIIQIHNLAPQSGDLVIPKHEFIQKYFSFPDSQSIINRIPEIRARVLIYKDWIRSSGLKCGLPPIQSVERVAVKESKPAAPRPKFKASKPIDLATATRLLEKSKIRMRLIWQSSVMEFDQLSFDVAVLNAEGRAVSDQYLEDKSFNFRWFSDGKIGKPRILENRNRKLLLMILNNMLFLEQDEELVSLVKELQELAQKRGGSFNLETFFQRYTYALDAFGANGSNDVNPALQLDAVFRRPGKECSLSIYPYRKIKYSDDRPPFEIETLKAKLLRFKKKCL